MNPDRSRARRTAVCLLALLCLAVPTTAYMARMVTCFYAGFDIDLPSNPGTFHADGGDLEASGPDVFEQQDNRDGNGVLAIHPNLNFTAAVLTGTLDEPCQSNLVEVSFTITSVAGLSDFIVGIEDQDNTGMIDLVFRDDEDVEVGGKLVDVPFDWTGDTLDVTLTLVNAFLGGDYWMLTMEGPGFTVESQGPLDVTKLNVSRVKLIRPGQTGGHYELDDLRVAMMVGFTASLDVLEGQ